MVSQNAPFLPMYEAWRADSRALLPYDDNQARKDAETIDAKVLSNRRPPYSLSGGLYDALKATNGDILMADNLQAAKAAELFRQTEGIDIHPAPAIALATLIDEVNKGNIDPKATIMLNITGGGEKRATEGKELWYLKPSLIFDLDPNEAEVIEKVEILFK
jgi:cysteate synthase